MLKLIILICCFLVTVQTSALADDYMETSLTGITGVIVDILISGDFQASAVVSSTMQSQVELILRNNNIPLFISDEDAYRVLKDSAKYVRTLSLTVNSIFEKYISGEPTGSTIFSITLEVQEQHSPVRPIWVPICFASIWEESWYGIMPPKSGPRILTESISNMVNIFANDFLKMNSKSTYLYIEEYYKGAEENQKN